MKKLIFILSTILLASCDQPSNIDKPINRENKPIVTTVYLYDTKEEVQKKYKELYKIPSSQSIDILGFAAWNEWHDATGAPIDALGKEMKCDIYAVRPKRVDDNATTTLGHELAHCIYGSFHKNGIG